ncbi:MAG: pyrroline-5-carboxylate reductase [Acidobacteria bacterium]|nr:pyrroline-5-carboxylate reductase [Acidobacteriota bacterium]
MTRKSFNKRVAVLGTGKMGGILLQAFLKQGLISPKDTYATVRHPEKAELRGKQLGVSLTTDNLAAARKADVILLCVKPQTVREVTEQIRPAIKPGKLVISIAASVPTSYIENVLGDGIPVIRAMPNTPCVVGSGMIGLCRGRFAGQSDLDTARKLFETVGRTVTVDEKHMDAVTGLSASGPAFIYIILEALAEAGVKVGLPRDVATLLAAQTTHGAAQVVLDTGDHPALLKDAVTTPAGCTIDGILELEEGKLRVTLIKAVVKATQRAKELILET